MRPSPCFPIVLHLLISTQLNTAFVRSSTGHLDIISLLAEFLKCNHSFLARLPNLLQNVTPSGPRIHTLLASLNSQHRYNRQLMSTNERNGLNISRPSTVMSACQNCGRPSSHSTKVLPLRQISLLVSTVNLSQMRERSLPNSINNLLPSLNTHHQELLASSPAR